MNKNGIFQSAVIGALVIYKLSDDIYLSGIIGVNDIELTVFINIANSNSHAPVGCA